MYNLSLLRNDENFKHILRLPSDNPIPDPIEYTRLINYHIKSGNDFEAKLLSRDQKINIDIDFSYNNGAISGIDKFTLTDPFGYIYEFEAKETTTSPILILSATVTPEPR